MEDGEKLYEFSSRPSVPREKTPDVLVKFQVVTVTDPCLFSHSLLVCSRNTVHQIRKTISKEFRRHFENGFVFLCKNKEVHQSREKTLTLFDILPRSGKGEPPNSQFKYPGVKYSQLAYDLDGGRRFTTCVGLVFLFEASSTSHWKPGQLRERLGAQSLYNFAFHPASITSANTQTIEFRINELCETAAKKLTQNGDKAKIKTEKQAQISAISKIFKFIGYDNPAENLQDARGATPLHYAAMNDNRHICEYIVMNCGPAMVQLRDVNNNNPLQCALSCRKFRTAAYLLEHTEDLGTPNITGVTCYQLLFNLSNADTTKLTKAVNPEVLDYVILLQLACFALQFRMLKEAKYLCKSLSPLPVEESFFRRPPLHLAAEFGDEETVQILLNKNHSVMRRDPDGHLPFHYACQHGQQELVPLLYDRKMEDEDYLKGMDLAIFHKRYETVLSVVQCRLQCQIPREFAYEMIGQATKAFLNLTVTIASCLISHPMGIQLLMHAAYSGNMKVFEILMNQNWTSDYMGRNVIHYIALKGHAHLLTNIATESLECPVAVQDWQGSTPMHCACMAGKVDVIKVFMKIDGINLASKDQLGRTPILVAAHYKKNDVVKYLISNHGGKLCLRSEDIYGKTILHYLSNMKTVSINHILKLFSKETKTVYSDIQKKKIYDPEIVEKWAIPNNRKLINLAIETDKHQQENQINPTNLRLNVKLCRTCGRYWKNGYRHPACFCTSNSRNDDDAADDDLHVTVGEPFAFHKYKHHDDGPTAIETAIIQNSPNILQRLLHFFPSWCESEEGKRLAQFASKHWRLECLKIVFTYIDPDEHTLDVCLHSAVVMKTDDELEHQAQLEVTKYLLDLTATPNYLPEKSFEEGTEMKFQRSYVPVRVLELCSTLEIAAMREDEALVDLLLKYGASTATNFATHLSALTGNLKIFTKLIVRLKQTTENQTTHLNDELRFVCQLESGILQAACSSKCPSLEMFKVILKHVPGVIKCKKLLTSRMIRNTRPAMKNILICMGDKVLESLDLPECDVHILPSTALLQTTLYNQQQYVDIENQLCFLIENGLFVQDVRVRRTTYVHGACSLFYSAKKRKMWRVVECLMKYAGDFFWKCMLSESNKCMLRLHHKTSCFIDTPLHTLRVMFEKGKETMMKTNIHTHQKITSNNEPQMSRKNIHPFQHYIEHVIQRMFHQTYVHANSRVAWLRILILFPNTMVTDHLWFYTSLHAMPILKENECIVADLIRNANIRTYSWRMSIDKCWSFLHVAAYLGLVNMADLCCSAVLPPGIDDTSDDGITALDIAAGNADVAMIEYLRKRGATANISTMKYACEGLYFKTGRKTAEQKDKERRKTVEAVYTGSNIDVNTGVPRNDHQTCVKDETSSTESKSLQESESTDNLTAKEKTSLLELAGIHKLWSVIEFLLDVGASVKVANDMFCDSNRTIFGLILRSAPASTALKFMKSATGLSREDELNMLKEAIRGEHPSVISEAIRQLFMHKLLDSTSWFHQNGWFSEIESRSFYTPLEVICINDHIDMLQFVLKETTKSRQQIQLDTQNGNSKTALWYSLTSNNFELAELLILNGATSTGRWNALGVCQKRHFKCLHVSSVSCLRRSSKKYFQVSKNNSRNIYDLFDLKNHADVKRPPRTVHPCNRPMTMKQDSNILNPQTRQRMMYLLSLAHFARQQDTTILHAAAAIGDVELVTRIMSMPYYPFLIKDSHGYSPLFYAIVNQQIDTCMVCMKNGTIDYSDTQLLEAWVFCTLKSQNPTFLQKLKVMPWTSTLDTIHTRELILHMIEKLEQTGRTLSRFTHPDTEHKIIDDQTLAKLLEGVLLKTRRITDLELFLAAVLGNVHLTDAIMGTLPNDAKYHFTRKLVANLSYPELLMHFSPRLPTDSHRMEATDRAKCLHTVLKVAEINVSTLITDIGIATGHLPLISGTVVSLDSGLDWLNEKHFRSCYSALEVLCMDNHIDIIQRILEISGMSKNQINLDSVHKERTPLWYALNGRHFEVAEFLLLNGACSTGKSSVIEFCQKRHFKRNPLSVSFLGIYPKRHFPCMNNNSKNIYELWGNKQHDDVKQPPTTRKTKTWNNETPMIQDSDTLHPQARQRIMYLLSLAHFARQQDTTILHAAAAIGDVELVTRIMSMPYYPFLIKDSHGYSPLFYAIVNQQMDICVLCKQNAMINFGETELFKAWVVCTMRSQKPAFVENLKAILRRKKMDVAKQDILEMISNLDSVANELSKFLHPHTESKALSNEDKIFQDILLKNKEITDLALFLIAVLGKPNLVDIIINEVEADAKTCFTKKLVADLTFLELLVYFSANNSHNMNATDRKQCLEKVLYVTGTNLSTATINICIASRSISMISDLLGNIQYNLAPIITEEQEKWSEILVHSSAEGCLQLVKSICDPLCFRHLNEVCRMNCIKALCFATWYKHSKIVRLLLENGLRPDDYLQTTDGRVPKDCTTPLHFAVISADQNVLQELLIPTENAYLKQDTVKESITFSAKKGNVNIFKILVQYGQSHYSSIFSNDFLESIWLSSTRNGHEDIALVIKRDLNFTDTSVADTNGITALHYACHWEMFTLTEEIVQTAAPNARDHWNMTPLEYARAIGHVRLSMYLIRQSTVKVPTHYPLDITGWMKYLLNENLEKSNGDVSVNKVQRQDGGCTSIADMLLWKDDSGACAMLDSAQETAVASMDDSYKMFPLFHLASKHGCLKTLQKLIELTDKYAIGKLSVWLNHKVNGYVPLALAIKGNNVKCADVLNKHDKCLDWSHDHTGENILHLLVRTNNKDMFDTVVGEAIITENIAEDRGGLSPMLLAIALGHRNALTHFNFITNPKHSKHVETDYTCPSCLLDMGIGWSKLFLTGEHEIEPIRDIFDIKERTADSTQNGLEYLSTILKWTDISQSERIVHSLLGAMGYEQITETGLLVLLLNSMNTKTDIVHYCLNRGKQASAIKCLQHLQTSNALTDEMWHNFFIQSIAYARGEVLDYILKNNNPQIMLKAVDKPSEYSLLEVAHAFGNRDIITKLQQHIQPDMVPFLVQQFEKMIEVLPLKTKWLTGLGCIGDKDWVNSFSNTSFRLSHADVVLSEIQDLNLKENIEMHAQMDTVIPATLANKYISVDYESLETSTAHLGLPPALIRVIIASHIFGLFTKLPIADESETHDSNTQFDGVRIKSLPPTSPDECMMELQNREFVDVVKFESVPTDGIESSLLLTSSGDLPPPFDNDNGLVHRITKDIIPAAEASMKDIVKHTVKISVDWTTIHNIGDKQLKSIAIQALADDVGNSLLGGLQYVISQCAIYLADIERLFGSMAVNSVIKLVEPLNEIVVRYSDEIPNSNIATPFGFLDHTMVWHFSLHKYHLVYLAEEFAILQTIKACHSIYLSLANGVHCLSLTLRQTSDKHEEESFVNTVEVDVDWKSFCGIGSSRVLAEFGRTSLGPCLIMTGHHYREILRLHTTVCQISLRNSANEKETTMLLNGSKLDIVIRAVKLDSSKWGIEGIDTLKPWIEMEIAQEEKCRLIQLCDDLSLLDRDYNDERLCNHVTESIIPVAEGNLQAILKHSVKVHVDWTSVYNIDDKRFKSLVINALAGTINNSLGGLQEVISQCKMYLTDIEVLFGRKAVDSVIKLVNPLKEIVVKYVEEIPNSNKSPSFGLIDHKAVWNFSLEKFHLKYLSEDFTILQTIKTCHSIYVSLSSAVHLLSEPWTQIDLKDRRLMFSQMEFDVNWTSFFSIGSSDVFAQYGNTVLRPYFLMIAHHYKQMLRLNTHISHISLQNSTSAKESMIRLDGDRLTIVVHTIKSHSSMWAINNSDPLKSWTEIEISELLLDWHTTRESIRKQHARLETALSYFQQMFDIDVSVLDNLKPVYEMIIRENMRQTAHPGEILKNHLSYWASFIDTLMRRTIHPILQFCPGVWFLKNCDLASGFWSWINRSALQNHFNSESKFMVVRSKHHGYFSDVVTYSHKVINVEEARRVKSETVVGLWVHHPLKDVNDILRLERMNMISLEGRLYYVPDSARLSNIINHLRENIQNIINTFSGQDWTVATLSVHGLIPKYGPSVRYPNSASIFKCLLIAAMCGTNISFVVDEIAAECDERCFELLAEIVLRTLSNFEPELVDEQIIFKDVSLATSNLYEQMLTVTKQLRCQDIIIIGIDDGHAEQVMWKVDGSQFNEGVTIWSSSPGTICVNVKPIIQELKKATKTSQEHTKSEVFGNLWQGASFTPMRGSFSESLTAALKLSSKE